MFINYIYRKQNSKSTSTVATATMI